MPFWSRTRESDPPYMEGWGGSYRVEAFGCSLYIPETFERERRTQPIDAIWKDAKSDASIGVTEIPHNIARLMDSADAITAQFERDDRIEILRPFESTTASGQPAIYTVWRSTMTYRESHLPPGFFDTEDSVTVAEDGTVRFFHYEVRLFIQAKKRLVSRAVGIPGISGNLEIAESLACCVFATVKVK